MYFLYILECCDKSYYTGITNDVVKRVREHYFRLPKAAKYTKSHQVTDLLCVFGCDNKSTALKLEYRIKRLSKQMKTALIEEKEDLYILFPDLSEYTIKRINKYNIIDIISEDA